MSFRWRFMRLRNSMRKHFASFSLKTELSKSVERSCFIDIARQLQPEAAAFPGVGFHTDRAAHALHPFPDNGQTDAGPGIFTHLMQPFKDPENSVPMLHVNADTI